MRDTRLVFVYGSLLRGFHNHPLLKGAKFRGEAVSRPLYTMMDLGSFPCISHGGNTPIHGEVWEVTIPQRNQLDRLEGHPRFYERSYIHLLGEPFRRWHVEAWFLDRTLDVVPLIPSGDWRAHCNHKKQK